MTVAKIIFRRGTTQEWETYNPILAEGEPGVDTTVDKMKIGDGVVRWKSLPYQVGDTQNVDAALSAMTTRINGIQTNTSLAITTSNEAISIANQALAQGGGGGVTLVEKPNDPGVYIITVSSGGGGGGGTDPETVRDTIASALVAGSGITVTNNDAANTITIAATGVGGSTDPEIVRDTIASALRAGTGVTIVSDDTANTITISSTATGGTTDPEIVRDTIASALVSGTNVVITVDDTANTIKIDATTVTDPEVVRDTMALALKAGPNITLASDDTANTITISAAGGASGSTDPEVVRDTMADALVAGANVTLAVDDTANTITISATGGSGGASDATTTAKGIIQLAGDLAGTAALPKVSKINGVTITNTPTTTNQILKSSGLAAALWADAVFDSTGGNFPYLITPTSTQDVGALATAKLLTYGAVVIGPNPGGYHLSASPILYNNGDSISGFGQGTTNLRASTALANGMMIQAQSGTGSHVTIRDMQLWCNNQATSGVFISPSGTPDTDVNPDYVCIIEGISVQSAKGSGINVQSGGYTSGARETRIRNCLVQGSGASGVRIASSDCFLSDITCHSNGTMGFECVSGASGNAKLNHCKAYYEKIGIGAYGSGISIVGGEVQDCTVNGIVTSGDNKIDTLIDTSGNSTTPGLLVQGTGCTFQVHMRGRNPPNSNVINAAVQFSSTTQVHAGLINTNVGQNATSYKAKSQGSLPTNMTYLTLA